MLIAKCGLRLTRRPADIGPPPKKCVQAARAPVAESAVAAGAPSPLPPRSAAAAADSQQRERAFEHAALFGRQCFERFGPNADFRFVNRAEAGAGRNQVAEDHVLLEADEVIGAAGERRFGEHLGRFLEAGGRDEAGALHRRLGDAQELRGRGGPLRLGALGELAAERLRSARWPDRARPSARSSRRRTRCRPFR